MEGAIECDALSELGNPVDHDTMNDEDSPWRAGSGQAVMTDTRMRIIFGLVAVMAISFLLIAFAKAQQSTIRDANGRISTTVTTDSNGTKTFRDGTGRTTGTATIDANGMTTFRNASGRTTGTASTSRR